MKASKRNTDYLLLNKNITKPEWLSGLLQYGSNPLILSITFNGYNGLRTASSNCRVSEDTF